MSSVRNAALQLPPPSSGRAAVSPDARQSIEFLCEPPAATGRGEARGRGGRAAQDDRVRKGGQKRRAPAVAGSKGKPKQRRRQTKHTEAEIDLDNSDGEAESEDLETAEDRGFIDPSSQDEHTGEHAAFDNSRQSEHTQRLAREEPEIQSEKKKTRSERRVLTALPERGMAEADRQVADYCYKAPYGLPTPNRLVTPYWKQQGRELVNNQLVSGAFGSDQHRTWCNDKRGQSDFASLFCTPWKENRWHRAALCEHRPCRHGDRPSRLLHELNSQAAACHQDIAQADRARPDQREVHPACFRGSSANVARAGAGDAQRAFRRHAGKGRRRAVEHSTRRRGQQHEPGHAEPHRAHQVHARARSRLLSHLC